MVISQLIPWAILIGAMLLQITVAPYLKIDGVHPDLILVLVIGWVTLRGWNEGFLWAVLGGLGLDFMSAAPFGIFSIALLLVTIVASIAHRLNFGSRIVIPLTLTVPLSFLFNGVALLILSGLGWPITWGVALTNILVPVAIFNTVVMVFIFPLLYLLNRWLNPEQLSF
jgi:rod shape-determining protein MreD